MDPKTKLNALALCFCAGLLVLANWRLHEITEKLDQRKTMSGQTVTIGSVVTERFILPNGELEPLAAWRARVAEAVQEFDQEAAANE